MQHLVIRRYRAGKDGNWLRSRPASADPQGEVAGEMCSSWVATVDDEPVGLCTWAADAARLDEGVALITRLWVDPPHRRQGLGAKLFRRAVSEIRKAFRKLETPLEQLEVTANCTDAAAWPFLRSLKFDEVEGLPVRRS